MAITALITAQTTAATSDAITLTGPTQIVADDLSIVNGVSEEVEVHRERADGTFEQLIIGRLGVVLTAHDPSIVIEGYSDIKVVKGVTANTVAVSYAS